MPNTLLTSSILAKESLMSLENQLTMAKAVNRDYSSKFGVENAKIGATYNLRKPPRYIGREGEAMQVESSTEDFVPITIAPLAGVDISFSSSDLTLHIDQFKERFLVPAMATVANIIDTKLTELYKDINRIVNAGAGASSYGTSGYLNDGSHNTLANVQGQVLTAGAILTESGVPNNNRSLLLDPMSQVSVITPLTALFNPAPKISRIFEDATMASNTLGFDWAVDPNIKQFTPSASGGLASGTSTGTLTASGATTIAVASVTAGTVPRGTVFSIAGVYAINPQSRQSTGRLMQFVVTADTVVTTTGTLPIYPAYIPSGQFATCTGSAAGGSLITVHTGASGAAGQSQNMAFHKDAFALVTVDQELPGGVDFAAREVYKNISLRLVRQYTISSNQMPCRIEVMYGVKTVYPELAVRLGG